MRRILFLTVVVALGCQSQAMGPSPASDAHAFAVTDLEEYVLPASPAEKVSIEFVYSNRSHDTVWIVSCRGPFPDLEKWVAGEWVRARGGPRLGCLSAFPVEPGGQLRGEVGVNAGSMRVDPIPGTYRLAWPEIVWNFETRTSTSLFGDLLPLEWRVSNRFVLRTE